MKKFFGFNKLLASVAVLASVMIFQSCLDAVSYTHLANMTDCPIDCNTI